MKKLILFALCFISLRVWAQQIDEQRMNRDLEVAKNILNTLISDNNNNMFFMNRSIDATYLPGYGVTFTLPDNSFWRIGLMKAKIATARPGFYSYSYEYKTPDTSEAPEIPDSNKNDNNNRVNVYVQSQKEMNNISSGNNNDNGESEEDFESHLKNAIMTFFSDYADLISQLGPDSRIRVIQKISPDFAVIAWSSDLGSGDNSQENQSTGFSAEVYKKDITAYKEGKINLDEFKKRVSFVDMNKASRVPDLDLFSKILKSYFSPDVSQTYFINSTPSYERIKDYGVIYSIRTYSSYQDNDVFRMPSTGQTLSQQDRNKKVEEMYPKFEEDIKNFVVDYGRAIHSLGDNEMLVMKINLTRCDECSMPKSIEVSVKSSVLTQYEQQKITRDKALAAITIKRNDQ